VTNFIDCLEAYNGAITAIATVFIAIFTIVLAFVTKKQLVLANEQIRLKPVRMRRTRAAIQAFGQAIDSPKGNRASMVP